jgi:hypothetical protein
VIFFLSQAPLLLKAKLKRLKLEIIKLFNNILNESSVKPIVENIDESDDQQQQRIQSCIDNFVKICCETLECKRFLCFYEEHYNLAEQLDLVYQITNNKM